MRQRTRHDDKIETEYLYRKHYETLINPAGSEARNFAVPDLEQRLHGLCFGFGSKL